LVAHTAGEHRLRVSENRVLRGIFGPKREEVTRDWRRLRKEELNYSADQTEKNDMVGASSIWRTEEVQTGFWRENRRERPL
jgi:hypothetical protein